MTLRIAILGLLLTPSRGVAGFSNFNSMLIGSEASGRGGAYTAVVGDSSAASFYNPATLSRIKGDSVSAAATVYNKYDITYGESEDILAAGERINRGFFRTIPSSLGAIFLNEDWFIALSIVVPDYDYFSGTVVTSPHHTNISQLGGRVSMERVRHREKLWPPPQPWAHSLLHGQKLCPLRHGPFCGGRHSRDPHLRGKISE